MTRQDHNDHNDHDESIIEQLARLDPTGHDAPPAVGSPRYINIKENAMRTTTTRPDTDDSTIAAPGVRTATTTRRFRRIVLGAAAATAVLFAGAILIADPGGSQPVEALVVDAADNLARYDSLRATLVRENVDGSRSEGTAEFDGDDIHTELVETDANGNIVYTQRSTVIGDTVWNDNNGEISEEKRGPNDRLTPFPEASQAVIKAALTGAEVTEVGTESVRGQQSKRYQITQTDESISALDELTPFELAWFELESPYAVTQIDVWIANDIIQQITVVDPTFRTTTTTFYDLGADIEITPPSS